MKVLVNMNLSPRWVPFLEGAGFEARHWSEVGPPAAPDTEILAWALANDFVVFTNDLDFSAILASSGAAGPGVFQLRTQDLLPEAVGALTAETMWQFEEALQEGTLVSVDVEGARARLLPISR